MSEPTTKIRLKLPGVQVRGRVEAWWRFGLRGTCPSVSHPSAWQLILVCLWLPQTLKQPAALLDSHTQHHGAISDQKVNFLSALQGLMAAGTYITGNFGSLVEDVMRTHGTTKDAAMRFLAQM